MINRYTPLTPSIRIHIHHPWPATTPPSHVAYIQPQIFIRLDPKFGRQIRRTIPKIRIFIERISQTMSKEVIVRNILIEMKIHGKGLDGFIQNIRYICQIPFFMYCGVVLDDIKGVIVGDTVRESDFRPSSIHDGKRGDPASHGVITTDIIRPTSPGFILIGNEEGMLGEFSTVGRVLVSAMRRGEDDCPAIGGAAVGGFEDGAGADVWTGIDEE